MKPWVLYAMVSMFFAGVTSVIAKVGLSGISGELGVVVRTCVVFVLVLLFAAMAVPASAWSKLTMNNVLWLSLSAFTTTCSWIFYYKALEGGEVSTIALIDKGSIVVAVVLAVVILKERLTLQTIVGAAMVLAGIIVIARK